MLQSGLSRGELRLPGLAAWYCCWRHSSPALPPSPLPRSRTRRTGRVHRVPGSVLPEHLHGPVHGHELELGCARCESGRPRRILHQQRLLRCRRRVRVPEPVDGAVPLGVVHGVDTVDGHVASVQVAARGGLGWRLTEHGPWDTQAAHVAPRDCQPPECLRGHGADVVRRRRRGRDGGERRRARRRSRRRSPSPRQRVSARRSRRRPLPIPPGGSTTVTVPFVEDETRTITVTTPGGFSQSFTFTRDCEHPAAVVSHACAASGLDVTVTNSGDGSGVFSIDGTSESLAPGESFTENVAVAEGASVQVTVLVDGAPVAGSPFTFTRDCEHPAAVVSHACAASGLDVTVNERRVTTRGCSRSMGRRRCWRRVRRSRGTWRWLRARVCR